MDKFKIVCTHLLCGILSDKLRLQSRVFSTVFEFNKDSDP